MGAWCVIAGLLVRGYAWHRDGKFTRALAAVATYCASCLVVFGHYVYGPPRAHGLAANAFIVLEGAAAMALLVYYLRAALAQAKTPVPATGKGYTVIKSISAKQRPRPPAKKGAKKRWDGSATPRAAATPRARCTRAR